MRKIFNFILLLLLAFSFTALPTTVAHAGFSYETLVNDDTIKNNISSASWYYEGVSYGEYTTQENTRYKAVVFGKNEKSYLNALRVVKNMSALGYEDCIFADFTIAVKSLPSEVGFGFTFGMASIESKAGSKNSSFLYFTKTGESLSLHISKFDENKTETKVLAGQALPTAELIKVSLEVSSAGGIAVQINDQAVYENAGAGLYTEGYCGFGQTGTSEVYLTSVEIRSLNYDNPQTGVLENGTLTSFADFTNDEFNVNEWYCHSVNGYYGGGIYIRDGKLIYDNASETVFSTTHKYSNFSLEMEWNDLQRTVEYDVNGNISRPVTSYLGFAFGRSNDDADSNEAHNVTQYLYIEPIRNDVVSAVETVAVQFRSGGNQYEPCYFTQEYPQYNFWDEEQARDRSMFIRFSMYDGQMKLELRYQDETDYTTVYTKDLGYTPLGYVQIWTTGHPTDTKVEKEQISATNYSLDNISITNTDNNPKTKVVSFVTNKIFPPADYPYVDTWNNDDLITGNWDGVSDIKDYTTLLIIAGGLFVSLIAGIVGLVIKRKKE